MLCRRGDGMGYPVDFIPTGLSNPLFDDKLLRLPMF